MYMRIFYVFMEAIIFNFIISQTISTAFNVYNKFWMNEIIWDVTDSVAHLGKLFPTA